MPQLSDDCELHLYGGQQLVHEVIRYIIFKEENYAGLVHTKDNLNDKTYDDAERFNNNYKTCMAMSEMQEMFKAINDVSLQCKPI